MKVSEVFKMILLIANYWIEGYNSLSLVSLSLYSPCKDNQLIRDEGDDGMTGNMEKF